MIDSKFTYADSERGIFVFVAPQYSLVFHGFIVVGGGILGNLFEGNNSGLFKAINYTVNFEVGVYIVFCMHVVCVHELSCNKCMVGLEIFGV